MEILEWANGNGQTIKLAPEEAIALRDALQDAIQFGKGNAVFDITEVDIVLKEKGRKNAST
jgi:hypothetical protein